MSLPPLSSRALIYDPFYALLKRHIIESTGLSYYEQKDEELAGHISQRMLALGVKDCGAYLGQVQGLAGQAELDVLIADLTIGETFFFRHREQFDALRDVVLPDIIQRNQSQRRLRIWSAGCSTGAEPYSLAILLKRELGALLAGWDVTILGTDINREFLAHAQRGEFGDWAFRTTAPELRQSCFSQTPNGRLWVIAPEFRQCVSFQYHNLVQHPFPSLVNNLFAFDLILCRNVMIYFTSEVNQRLISQFYETLVENGWLLVGHVEPNIEMFRAYRTVNVPGAVLYQKSGQPAPRLWPPLQPDLASQSEWMAPSPTGSLAPPALRTDWLSPGLWSPAPLPEPILPPVPSAPTVTKPAPQAPAPSTAPTLAEIRAKADQGQWEEAARLTEALTIHERLNPEAHFFQALVLEQVGRHQEAEQALRRTIYLDRNYVLAHYYLGLTLQRKRDTAGAARSFRNVIKLVEGWDDAKTFENADGLTVAALKQLTQMQLSVLAS